MLRRSELNQNASLFGLAFFWYDGHAVCLWNLRQYRTKDRVSDVPEKMQYR